MILLANILTVVLVAIGIALLLIGGALLMAAVLPQGHPQAARLRDFASTAPTKAWRWALQLDKFFWIGVLALFVFLTLGFS